MRKIMWLAALMSWCCALRLNAEADARIRCAVYTPGVGSKAIYSALKKTELFDVDYFSKINLKTLLSYQVVIFPGVRNPDNTIPEWRSILRAYVEDGHGILFTHYSCGLAGAFAVPLFPEIFTGMSKEESHSVKVLTPAHAIARKLAGNFETGYADHIVLELGAQGESIIGDEKGNHVTICGKAGKGKVIGIGFPIGYASWKKNDLNGRELEPAGDEKQLLINSVQWLGEGAKKSEGASGSKEMDNLVAQNDQRYKKTVVMRAAQDDFEYDLLTRLFLIGLEIAPMAKGRDEFMRKKERIEESIRQKAEDFRQRFKALSQAATGTSDADENDIAKSIAQERAVWSSKIEALEGEVAAATARTSDRGPAKAFDENYCLGSLIFHYGDIQDKETPFRPDLDSALRIANKHLGMNVNYLCNPGFIGEILRGENKSFLDVLKLHEKNNVRLFVPVWFSSNRAWSPDISWLSPDNIAYAKDYLGKIIAASGGSKAFAGFVFDEPRNHNANATEKAYFLNYLAGKGDAVYWKNIGVVDAPTGTDYLFKQLDGTSKDIQVDPVLLMEWREFKAGSLSGTMKELISHARSLRDDIAMVPVEMLPHSFGLNKIYESPAFLTATLGQAYCIDYGGKDSRECAFMSELARGSAKGPFWLMPGYPWTGGQSGWERNIATSFLHSDGFIVWEWEMYWKYPPRPNNPAKNYLNGDSMRSELWRPWGWDATEPLYRKARSIGEYLSPTVSAAEAAILVSARSSVMDVLYIQQQKDIYNNLTERHLQSDVVS